MSFLKKMRKVYFSPQKRIFVKTLPEPVGAVRELVGAAVFSQFVEVPEISLGKDRILRSQQVLGERGDRIDEGVLNNLIIELLARIKKEFRGERFCGLEIGERIRGLRKSLGRSELSKLLDWVEGEFEEQPLYPVHGDLQKQNIFVQDGELVLIDFEHFCFAPIELELVNSLFFNDKNCLAVEEIIPILWQKRIISFNLLGPMLVFYALKHLEEKGGFGETKKKLKKGFLRLERIISSLGAEEPDYLPQFKEEQGRRFYKASDKVLLP